MKQVPVGSAVARQFVLLDPIKGPIPVGAFAAASFSTGVREAVPVTIVSGLTVEVAAGSGFIVDKQDGHFYEVAWQATEIELPQHQTECHLYFESNNGALLLAYDCGEPGHETAITIAEFATNGTSVILTCPDQVVLQHRASTLHDWIEYLVGPLIIDGGSVSHADLYLSIDDGVFSRGGESLAFPGDSSATFTYWWRHPVDVWSKTKNVEEIYLDVYDDASGTPAAMTAGKWRRDTIYVGGDGTFHVVLGQVQFDAQVDATSDPVPPEILASSACRLAGIVIQEGAASIAAVVDSRPRLGQYSPPVTGTITDHNLLSGRSSPTSHSLATALSAGFMSAAHFAAVSGLASTYQALGAKGLANGYASLDGGGLVPFAQLPVGSSANTVCSGTDVRLSDARPPLAHADSHDTGIDKAGTSTPTADRIVRSLVGSAKIDTAWLNTGTGAGQVATGDHSHTGVYSPVSHNHDGTYEPALVASRKVDHTTITIGGGYGIPSLGDLTASRALAVSLTAGEVVVGSSGLLAAVSPTPVPSLSSPSLPAGTYLVQATLVVTPSSTGQLVTGHIYVGATPHTAFQVGACDNNRRTSGPVRAIVVLSSTSVLNVYVQVGSNNVTVHQGRLDWLRIA